MDAFVFFSTCNIASLNRVVDQQLLYVPWIRSGPVSFLYSHQTQEAICAHAVAAASTNERIHGLVHGRPEPEFYRYSVVASIMNLMAVAGDLAGERLSRMHRNAYY